MTLSNFAKQAERFVGDNSPAIITGIAVTGVVATAYLTGKATFKAANILEDYRKDDGHIDSRVAKDAFRLTWKLYIPAATTASLTIASVICANRISSRRTAAIAAAYSLSERAFSEYKEKVVHKIGEKASQAVHDEVAQERIAKDPVSIKEVIITGNGDVLCYDSITGRYFQSNVESLRSAQNTVNEKILNHMYASLTEFYELVGLSATDYSEEVGWNVDNVLKINFSTIMSEDNRPCIVMDYDVAPIRNYHRLQ